MNNFCKIAEVNIRPLLAAIARQPELWDENNFRTTHQGTVHADASDIWLRYNNLSDNIINDLESIDYPAFAKLPQARALVYDLMRFVEGNRLGRVFITKLPVNGRILPHKDEGESPEYYDRYHIFIQNFEGSVFRCGEEVICPNAGDIYWFNNQIEHEVINNSIDDRLTLVIDIRSK